MMMRSFLKFTVILCVFLLLTGCVPPPEAAGSAGQMSPFEFIFSTVWFILIAIFVYYMLVLRPEAIEQQSRETFLSALKKNDEVVTSGGILGKVSSIKDDCVMVEIASNVRIKVLPSALKPRQKKDKDEA